MYQILRHYKYYDKILVEIFLCLKGFASHRYRVGFFCCCLLLTRKMCFKMPVLNVIIKVNHVNVFKNKINK